LRYEKSNAPPISKKKNVFKLLLKEKTFEVELTGYLRKALSAHFPRGQGKLRPDVSARNDFNNERRPRFKEGSLFDWKRKSQLKNLPRTLLDISEIEASWEGFLSVKGRERGNVVKKTRIAMREGSLLLGRGTRISKKKKTYGEERYMILSPNEKKGKRVLESKFPESGSEKTNLSSI